MDCPHRMMSYTDLHLRQAMRSIHRIMVIFPSFNRSLSVSIWKVYFYPARKIEKKEGGFPLFSHKKGNGLGVTKINVGGYSYTASWAVHYKPKGFRPTKWNLSAWLPGKPIYLLEEKKFTYLPMFKMDSCSGYDHGVCGSAGSIGWEFWVVERSYQYMIHRVDGNLVWVWNFNVFYFSFK